MRRFVYPVQKFDSEPERRFAIVLESDPSVVKWVRPLPEHLRIDYAHGSIYEPDFVVETASHKHLCEVKRANEMGDPDVRAKADAAVLWCAHASEHERRHGGKPWTYLLTPHDAVTLASSLDALAAQPAVRD